MRDKVVINKKEDLDYRYLNFLLEYLKGTDLRENQERQDIHEMIYMELGVEREYTIKDMFDEEN